MDALSDDARAALQAAFAEAKRHGDRHVGCEHLLLGLLVEGASCAARLLAERGLTLERARERLLDRPPSESSDFGMPVTARMTSVVAIAEVEAERLGSPLAGADHLMLALLTEGHSQPVQELPALGVDLERFRGALVTELPVPEETRRRYLAERAAAERARRELGIEL